MIKKKKKLTLGVTAAALVASAIPAQVAPVLAAEKEELQTPTSEKEVATAEKIYLSDLQYIESMSNTGYGSIKKDRNVDGKYLGLIVNGERTEFDKGMGVHANSNLVYDISEYSNTYTRIKARIGLDASKGSNGNGVILYTYVSDDGKQWREVHRTGVQKGDMESVDLDVNIAGAKYIKLTAHHNGGNSYDHVSYGDLKLVKDDYVEVTPDALTGLMKVADYDAILASKSVKQNLQENEMLILQRAFVSKVGYGNIVSIANKNESYKSAVEFLLSNQDALSYFIANGDVNVEGSFTTSLREFCEVYSKYGAELHDPADNNFNLRLAVSIALAQANPINNRFWMLSNTPYGAVVRYETYQDLVTSGKMDLGGDTDGYGKWSTQQFKDLPITMMRWVVDNRINDDEVQWLADFTLSKKAEGKDYLSAYTYINYTGGYNYDNPALYDEANKEEFNAKFGNFEDYFDGYGTKGIYRLWMIFQEGSVCGGLAKTYSNIADMFGRPSSVVGQPGHAATMTWGWNTANQRYEWMLQNDVFGWAKSGNEYSDRMLNWGNKSWAQGYTAGYNIIATDAVLDSANFSKATLLNFLAQSYADNADKKAIYREAVDTQAINIDSWEGLINAYKADSNTTSADYLALSKEIIKTFTYYPQAMVELLALIQSDLDSAGAIQVDILKNNALASASKATPDVSTNVAVTKALAGRYLDGDDFGEVATFSFDGDNAGKIVLNSKYEDAQITLEYSLDGGTKWTQTSDKVITLSKEELASLTADNDIKVRLLGVDTIHTIDILAGQSAVGKVKVNDFENLLLGTTANLEFSLDGGTTWCDYVTVNEDTINPKGLTGIRFDGDKEVEVRYKAYGQYLQGEGVTFTFTANVDTETAQYIQQRHVKVTSASAHQGGHEPAQAVDGNLDNGFHTKYNVTTEDKHIIFEFDEPRYISALDYVFIGGNNGRMKDGEILASMDGQTWEVIKTFSNMPRGVNEQKYEMDKVVKAKFIKLAPTQTHGNNSGETNMYFAMKEVRFYEDTVKAKAVQSPIIIVDELPEVPTPSSKMDVQSPIEYK